MYWLLFKIEFLEMMKRERKKINIKTEREYNSEIKSFKFLKASMIKKDIIIAVTNWGNFVNLKNLIII